MSVGILYIAIGRYASFFEDFYKSCELHLFPGTNKNYYVYSDVIDGTNYASVKVIKATDHGWPGNTLMRFDMFADSQAEWQDNDYMLFLNGNTLVLNDIRFDEIFPYDDIDTVTTLSWHVYDAMHPKTFPYERNPESVAFIPLSAGERYYQGGLFGARTKAFIRLVNQCRYQIAQDFERGMIAVNHDESHLNRYLLDKSVYTLTTIYGRPEEWQYPENPKLIFRDKNRLLGIEYIDNLKHRSNRTFLQRLKTLIKRLIP